MSFFFGKGKKDATTTNNRNSEVRSSGVNKRATVNLAKAEASLNRSIVNLTKKTGVDLGTHRARVCVVMDRSGSMGGMYRNGDVQDVLTRLLPLALKFDDNGELEVYVFNTSCNQVSEMNLKNYEDYVEKQILRKGLEPCGGTNYAPAIKQTMKDYNDGSPYPAFVIFITDGANFDCDATDHAIRKSSKHKIFYQFVGIGRYESFDYLQKLDDLDGRAVDNTAFIKVEDFSRMDDDQLYDKLLEQYPQWLKVMHIN